MFNLGFSELVLLAVVALVFIGPKQLPEVARVIGRLINEWKRATSDFSLSIKDNEAFREWEKRKNDYLAEMKEQINTPLRKDPENREDAEGAPSAEKVEDESSEGTNK